MSACPAGLPHNVGMDYALRFDRWYGVCASLFGIGPGATRISLTAERLTVRQGRRFAIEVPRTDIAAVRPVTAGPGFGWGIGRTGDAWAVTGSRRGIVEVRFGRAILPGRTPIGAGWFNTPVRGLYLSLADPAGFVAALRH